MQLPPAQELIGTMWTLRNAAREWLREHPESLNAPAVRKAIEEAGRVLDQ